MSWKKTTEELKKCVLLCANCHREVHDGTYTQQLKSSYDEERASVITQKIYDLKHHKVKYCPECGKIISQKASYCKECAEKHKRKVLRPNRDELKRLIRSTPFIKIGAMYGVSDNAVRKWCKFYDLPSKSKEIKKYSVEEWIKI